GLPSSVAGAASALAVPAAPMGLTAKSGLAPLLAGAARVQLSWISASAQVAAKMVDSYIIYRKPSPFISGEAKGASGPYYLKTCPWNDPLCFTGLNTPPGSDDGILYEDASAAAEQGYYYAVTAVNA